VIYNTSVVNHNRRIGSRIAPGDAPEDKMEVLFAMDPGQVVEEQVVRR
jgi:hypothetical protein